MPEVRDAGRVGGGPPLRPLSARVPALATDGRSFFTRHGGGGRPAYGEEVVRGPDGHPWRRFEPRRSKTAAALHAGGLGPELEAVLSSPPLLYLGAASGTSLSHLADIVAPEPAYGVEVAQRSFADLLENLRPWPNVFPVHADARRPAAYAALVGRAGAIVQDVAAADQVAVLAGNARAFLPDGAPALLFLKARSVDSGADPPAVFEEAREALAAAGFGVREQRALEPFDRDHRAFLVRWRAA
ncbi:MAG TPA: fibrillarin-like rRNA/tRNA 2'-O-methyltransferase [Candidatus Thermoplasmatota archaeon]